MLTSIIYVLILICIVALVFYLIIWVLRDVVGLPLPERVVQILMVIFALIVILLIVQMVLPGGGGFPRLLR